LHISRAAFLFYPFDKLKASKKPPKWQFFKT